jgi:protocatechuate 3,4-dioxygenase beta subunit
VDPDAARAQVTRVARQSEADGGFDLGGLLPGRYEVTSTGWRSRPGPLEPVVVELESGADVNDVRLVMPAVGTVRGRVLDGSGKPVAGATISASSIDMQGYGESRSNDAGEFTFEHLRPGQARIAARSSEYWWTDTMRKPGTTDDDLQGEVVRVVANETVELTLTVESRDGRITGVVKDEDGGPVSDAFIDAERMSEKAGANAASARRGVRWGGGTKPVLTDADGRFELDQLPDGRYVVGANRKGGGQAVLEDVALGSHIELIISSTGELAGTVTLAGGGAPERFTISLADKAAGINLSDSYYRTDGVWHIREVPAGSYEITATASEGTTKLEPAITLGEGEVRENLELVLEPRVTVRGRLIDLETREPVAGLEVMVAGNGSFMLRNTGPRQNVTGADGRFEVADAPTGRVEIIAWNRTGGSKAKYGWHHQVLTVESEPAVQDVGDIEVVARRLENNEKPGDLGFALNDWDPTIEPEEWKPVVASVRPGGPADGSGLVAGDVIEKVNGHDVLGKPGSRYGSLTQVPVGTTITLGLSEGKTVEIIAGPAID